MRRASSTGQHSIARHVLARAALAFLVLPLALPAAFADDWPARPIKLLVPGEPGSTSDILARVFANELTGRVGQPIVVIDRPGAGGTIAMAELARTAADGYTIAFATQGSLVIAQALYSTPGYDSLKDFAPIALVGGTANALIVNPANPAMRLQDVVAAAKRSPRTLTYSSGGNGSSHHLSAVLFAQMSAIDLVHVAYRAPAQAIRAVVSGEVAMGFFNIPTVIAQIRSGQVRALAVTSRERSPLLPDVPTLDEEGVRGYEVNTWFGFIAPRGTPPDIVARLNGEFARILSLPRIRETLSAQGYDVASPMPPSAFVQRLRDDAAKWFPIVKASGATTH